MDGLSVNFMRYYQMEPTINTGNNLRKELERLEEVVIINDLVKIVLNQC